MTPFEMERLPESVTDMLIKVEVKLCLDKKTVHHVMLNNVEIYSFERNSYCLP